MAKLHDDLKEKVLHVTILEQWSNDITAKFNDVEGRVDNLEHCCDELA